MNNDFTDLGGNQADFSDLGGTPQTQSGPSSEIGFHNMGAPIRGVSDFLRNVPGLNFVPQAAGDIFELGRGAAGMLGNTKGYGHTDNSGNYVKTENPFRGQNVEEESRNQANPFGAAADVGKSALGAAATLYGSGAINNTLAGTGASQSLAASHPILEMLGRTGLTGLLNGTARGIGTEKPTPLSVGGTAVGEGALNMVSSLLSKGLTTKGVWSKAGELAKNDDTEHELSDIKTEAQKMMEDKMGSKYTLNKRAANQILDTLIKDKGPVTGEGTGLSSKELLDWQGELSKASQGNFIQKLLGSVANPNADIQAQVAEALRSTISSRLKDIPGMGLQNALYALYKNPVVGSPVSWPVRAAGLEKANELLGHLGVKL